MASNYHMIEYIREGPAALARTLQNNEPAIAQLAARVQRGEFKRVVITGVGSSFTAAVMADPMFRYHATVPVHILPCNEIELYGRRLIDEATLVIVVSRSGERGAVADAISYVLEQGAYGVAMTGFGDSLLAQTARLTLLTAEGPEITFSKTKSVVVCAGLLMRFALALAAPDDSEAVKRNQTLQQSPQMLQRAIEVAEPFWIKQMPELIKHTQVVVAGTGSNLGVALEAGVKIQETTYVATHGDDTINVLYGPLGAVTDKWLTIVLATPQDEQPSKNLLGLIRRFHSHSLAVATPDVNLAGASDYLLQLPEPVDPLLAGLVYLPTMQLLTYYWTLALGMNPDEPTVMREMLEAMLPPGREEPELRVS